ncbi:MAG: hypothetical protein LBV50_06735 [Novosphingobium sp.]|jgi:hypothetical protein|nr:hypothetical protein [Novosphingobium sp.]
MSAHANLSANNDNQTGPAQPYRAEPYRPMPAYCDPANEKRGDKYEATRTLGPAEISKRIRADIKAAREAGTIPAGVKTSVRLDTYSGGWAIDVKITALPEGFAVLSEKYASWVKQFGEHRLPPMAHADTCSDEVRALTTTLQEIVGDYNRDNSDAMSDYYDCRFHGSVGVDYDLSRNLRAAEIAASPGKYWADDS